jgi:uncharacterized protein (TIGR03067 family)
MKKLQFIFFLLPIILLSCGVLKNKMNEPSINGTWIPIRQEMGGQELPMSFFQTQKLIIKDSAYVLIAESMDKGSLNYANGKMDIYGEEGENIGNHFMALYKLEDNFLTIVYNLAGDSYPSDFETQSKETLFLSVFRREE